MYYTKKESNFSSLSVVGALGDLGGLVASTVGPTCKQSCIRDPQLALIWVPPMIVWVSPSKERCKELPNRTTEPHQDMLLLLTQNN